MPVAQANAAKPKRSKDAPVMIEIEKLPFEPNRNRRLLHAAQMNRDSGHAGVGRPAPGR
jgi:hypothetical protein